jgi:PadR family transcriptional regulator PadR
MVSFRRPSEQATAVVLALAEDPATWRYGYELCKQLDLKAGSVYPILMRLADRGLLETTWEPEAPAGRPARHLSLSLIHNTEPTRPRRISYSVCGL